MVLTLHPGGAAGTHTGSDRRGTVNAMANPSTSPAYVPPAIAARTPVQATLGSASSGPLVCAYFDK